MPVNWPQHLTERIAAEQWVLFIGSGVSATCENSAGESPPTWSALLTTLCDLIPDPGEQHIGRDLIARNQLLSAADHIRYCLDHANALNSYQTTIRRAVDGPLGDPYTPSLVFDDLLTLDARIVFTTNYDKLFEIASRGGYSTHSFNSATLGGDLRRGDPVPVKLHGSTDSIAEVVLTRTDFSRVMRDGAPVLEALHALSLTSTILFVGYSLDDPDIQLALQAVGRGPLDPEAHYMLSPEPPTPSRIPVYRQSFGVTVLTYPAGDHAAVHDALSDLIDSVATLIGP
jgi:hypothetical protein